MITSKISVSKRKIEKMQKTKNAKETTPFSVKSEATSVQKKINLFPLITFTTPYCFEATSYGNTLLDTLENLKTQLIMGRLSQQTLQHLEDALETFHVEEVKTKALQDLLLEIQTRVAVEIEKWQIRP